MWSWNPSLLISFGVVLGLAVGIVVRDVHDRSPGAGDLWSFAGTLIGAAVTVLGAYWLSENKARRALIRQHRALIRQQKGARALLAMDLAVINDYTDRGAAAIINGGEEATSRECSADAPKTVKIPALDPEVPPRLQRLVELLDGPDADQIADLMDCMQVHHSGLSGELETLNNPVSAAGKNVCVSPENFQDLALKLVELHLRTNRLFGFARRKAKHIPPPPFNAREVCKAIDSLGLEFWLSEEAKEKIVKIMTSDVSFRNKPSVE